MDKSSIGGVLLAIVGIVAGLLMEGGHLGQILQPTAAMIVFGGTMGAVLLQFPLNVVLAAFKNMAHVFRAPRKQDGELIKLLIGFANKARRNGVVSLDADLASIQDPFLRQAMMLAVDGTEPTDLRNIMQVSLGSMTESEDRLPAVFESAGGFSPTIGILGAVLGLIRSCSIWTTSAKSGAASPSHSSLPFMESESQTCSFCPWQARCDCACAASISGAK